VQLEIELEDRTLEVDVPPLEAAFIELLSEKRNFYFWFLDVLDIADRSIFPSYLGSRRPYRGCWGPLIEARLSRRYRHGSIMVFS
jgi:hypothetical protein